MPFPSGNHHWNWKEGRWKTKGGYIRVLQKGHPNSNKRGYILEHRLVVSTYLGRPLTKYEVVHHKNGIRDDNRIENLRLLANGPHLSLHNTGRKHYAETKLKISLAHQGIKQSTEHSLKIRLAHIGNFVVDMSGRKCSECGTNNVPFTSDKKKVLSLRPHWRYSQLDSFRSKLLCGKCYQRELQWRHKNVNSNDLLDGLVKVKMRLENRNRELGSKVEAYQQQIPQPEQARKTEGTLRIDRTSQRVSQDRAYNHSQRQSHEYVTKHSGREQQRNLFRFGYIPSKILSRQYCSDKRRI